MIELKECIKYKRIPCEHRLILQGHSLCNAPPEIGCRYADPLKEGAVTENYLAREGGNHDRN